MNTYEAKQEAKRQRYLERAEKAKAKSTAHFDQFNRMSDRIPMGQPILVGHHSEKSDRNFRARIDKQLKKSVTESKKAKHYECKAAAVGKGGVSSDDPEAVVKLKAKIDKLEKDQQWLKAVNAAWRKVGKPEPVITEENRQAWESIAKAVNTALDDLTPMRKCMSQRQGWHGDFTPCPKYRLTNNGSNIRRLKQRLVDLAAEPESLLPDGEELSGDGWHVEECPEDNRIRFHFDERPNKATCQMMRSNGWRWSRYNSAWQRHLNGAGRCSARCVAEKLRV